MSASTGLSYRLIDLGDFHHLFFSRRRKEFQEPSGLEITTDLKRRFAIDEIRGRNGLSLFEHWSDRFKTLHGIMSDEFPNLFLTGYTQGGVAAAINLMYDQQGEHIAYIISETLARGAKTVEPTTEAREAWQIELRETAVPNASFWNECTPGYYNKEGGEAGTSPIYGDVYGPGFYAFEKLLADWRADGRMQGLQLSDHDVYRERQAGGSQ